MQSADCSLDMIAHINLDDRLSILRVGDPFRSWNSLDDQRVCVLCGRKFKGRQLDIRRLPGSKFKLCCPTLGGLSTRDQWPATPAVCSDSIQEHWRHDLPNKAQHRAPQPLLRTQPCRV